MIWQNVHRQLFSFADCIIPVVLTDSLLYVGISGVDKQHEILVTIVPLSRKSYVVSELMVSNQKGVANLHS